MKLIILLSFICLGMSAPQLRHSFQDHFDDFMILTRELEGAHFGRQTESYLGFEEFTGSLAYLASKDFVKLFEDLKDVAEFNAVLEFLKDIDVDAYYYLELIQRLVDEKSALITKKLRHPITGRTMTTYLNDIVSMFPRKKLRELFDEKMDNEKVFSGVVKEFRSEEWKNLYEALWENDKFKAVVDEMAENDFDLRYVLDTVLLALFGQIEPFPLTFQDHFDDFVDTITALKGKHFEELVNEYLHFEEFQASLNFIADQDFIDVLQELMEVPAYATADAYLKSHNIFPAYYIDRFHLLAEKIQENASGQPKNLQDLKHHHASGRTMRSFLIDIVDMFPEEILEDILEEKVEEDTEFRNVWKSLRSEEWEDLYEALWETDIFKTKAAELAQYDFNLEYFFNTLVLAIFGQE